MTTTETETKFYVTSYNDMAGIYNDMAGIQAYEIMRQPSEDIYARTEGAFDTLAEAISCIQQQGLVRWSDASIVEHAESGLPLDEWEHKKPRWDDWWEYITMDDAVIAAAEVRPAKPDEDELEWFYADWWDREADEWPEYHFGQNVGVVYCASPDGVFVGRKCEHVGLPVPDLTDEQWSGLERLLDEQHRYDDEIAEYLRGIGFEVHHESGENGYQVDFLLVRPA